MQKWAYCTCIPQKKISKKNIAHNDIWNLLLEAAHWLSLICMLGYQKPEFKEVMHMNFETEISFHHSESLKQGHRCKTSIVFPSIHIALPLVNIASRHRRHSTEDKKRKISLPGQ
jgi:hypothetical protein